MLLQEGQRRGCISLVVWRHFPAVADSSEILECNNNDNDHTNDDEDEGDERENLHRVGCKLANH